MQLSFFEDETPVYEADSETCVCKTCGVEKPLDEFGVLFTTQNSKKSYRLKNCRRCHADRVMRTAAIKKTAPPKPENCDCCGVSFKDIPSHSIHMDHCEETNTFRGWLCRQCNYGIGQLGDNIEGLQKALKYLQDHNGRLSKEAD